LVDKQTFVWIQVEGEKKLATQNLVPGNQVYNEKLVQSKEIEYRIWNPFRSKLAAAIMNDLKNFHLIKNLMSYTLEYQLEPQ